MSKFKIGVNKEQILHLREQGLNDAQELHSMQAYGKIAGMDVFSWVNPDSNSLTAVLYSVPFKVTWLATKEQVEKLLNEFPEGFAKLDSVVVYDAGHLAPEFDWLKTGTNVACIDGVDDAMALLSAMKKRDRVFLYSMPRDNWSPIKNSIERHLKTWN